MSLKVEAKDLRKRVKAAPIDGWVVEGEHYDAVGKYSYDYRPINEPYCTAKQDNVGLAFKKIVDKVNSWHDFDEDYPERPKDPSDTAAWEAYKNYVSTPIREALADFKSEWDPRRQYTYTSNVQHSDVDRPLFKISIRPVRLCLGWKVI